MLINQTNGTHSTYQSTSLENNGSLKGNSREKLEVISFDSLLSDSDRRTISAMEIHAKKNGISDKEFSNLKSAIGAKKAMALFQGTDIPNIDKKMMSEIYDGAKAGRLSLNNQIVDKIIANFNQLQGVDFKA